MRKVFYKEKKQENEKLLKTCLRVAISILFIDDRLYQRNVMRATSNKWLFLHMKYPISPAKLEIFIVV